MFNGGMLAIELPEGKVNEIFELAKNGTVDCSVNIDTNKIRFSWSGGQKEIDITLSDFDRALVKAGGWVEFADARY
jgi:3-isopropylmalate/(R)-2-methylmalate dehydratase small subunit